MAHRQRTPAVNVMARCASRHARLRSLALAATICSLGGCYSLSQVNALAENEIAPGPTENARLNRPTFVMVQNQSEDYVLVSVLLGKTAQRLGVAAPGAIKPLLVAVDTDGRSEFRLHGQVLGSSRSFASRIIEPESRFARWVIMADRTMLLPARPAAHP